MRKPKYKLLSLKKVLSTILDDVKVQNEFTCGITLEQFNRFFDTYARKFEKTLTNNGKEYTLELFKAIQNQSISLVTKENFDPIPFHKSNKEGISTLLIPVLSILQSDRYKEIRIILSVTRLHESIRLEPELDLNPLFKPYDGEQELSVALEDYDSFLNVSPWASKIRLDHPKIKVSNLLSNRIRSGPNGQGVLTSHYDAVAVVNDEKLFKSLLRFNNILNQDTISQNLL